MISIAETKAAEEKMPSGRRNDSTRVSDADQSQHYFAGQTYEATRVKKACVLREKAPRRKLLKKKYRVVDEMVPLER